MNRRSFFLALPALPLAAKALALTPAARVWNPVPHYFRGMAVAVGGYGKHRSDRIIFDKIGRLTLPDWPLPDTA